MKSEIRSVESNRGQSDVSRVWRIALHLVLTSKTNLGAAFTN
jgi:hypothetical protein